MARRKDKESQKETKLEKARKRLWGVRTRLGKSLLGPLLDHVRVVECEGKKGDPKVGAFRRHLRGAETNGRMRGHRCARRL